MKNLLSVRITDVVRGGKKHRRNAEIENAWRSGMEKTALK
jgi:hypothetical protein